MFTLKLKGNANTVCVNEVEFDNGVQQFKITTEKQIEMLLMAFKDGDNLLIKIKDKFVKVWSIYFNSFKNTWICEGINE